MTEDRVNQLDGIPEGFTLFPALDLRRGRCVRLRQGDFAQETVFADDPAEAAETWARAGARALHVVDLDGALEGAPRNLAAVERIAREVGLPLQFGGGLRDEEALDRAFGAGIARAVIGTKAIEDPAFLARALGRYGSRIAVGIDARQGLATTGGWLRTSAVPAPELARRVRELGAAVAIYTDIGRDGMLDGPDFKGIEALLGTGLSVIASGGITSLGDVRRLAALAPRGLGGAIVGKALYTGRLDLAEALAACGEG